MVRMSLLRIWTMALFLCAFVSFSIDSLADQGAFTDVLRRSLQAIEGGTPNYQEMEPMTADGVERSLGPTRAYLSRMGAIQKIEYRGIQDLPLGKAEYYHVTFENGEMSWMIDVNASRKIDILWSPN